MNIAITKRAYQKLKYYIAECDAEISGFGKVRKTKDGFEVYDIEILRQTVGNAHATISAESMAGFLYEKMKAKKPTDVYRCWWHSHYNFGAFFSGVDTGTIDAWNSSPYLISIVSNKAGEMVCRYDEYAPRRTVEHIIVDTPDEDAKLRAEIRMEVAEKIVIQKPVFNWGGKKGKKKKWKNQKRWWDLTPAPRPTHDGRGGTYVWDSAEGQFVPKDKEQIYGD